MTNMMIMTMTNHAWTWGIPKAVKEAQDSNFEVSEKILMQKWQLSEKAPMKYSSGETLYINSKISIPAPNFSAMGQWQTEWTPCQI